MNDWSRRPRLIPLTKVRLYVVGAAVQHPFGDHPV